MSREPEKTVPDAVETRTTEAPAVRSREPLPARLVFIVIAAALVLFVASIARHMLFKSASFDLGIFDQALYLISRGETPFVTLTGFHILGDHAAIVFYPISILYRIMPTPYWLFAIQSAALSSGAIALYLLSRERNLSQNVAIALACAYLLHPLIFNASLFDFHADTIAPAAILFAVLAIDKGRVSVFLALLLLTLSCKAAFSLTIVGMGIWLLLSAPFRHAPDGAADRRRIAAGVIAIILGVSWFWIASRHILAAYNPGIISALVHFKHLGDSPGEILASLIFDPGRALAAVATLRNLEYLALLIVPMLWGLSIRSLLPLTAALPALALNLLGAQGAYKDLVHHYSLPILPFLYIAVIEALARKEAPVQTPIRIVICALAGFLALAKFGYFFSIYLATLDNRASSIEALRKIDSDGPVVASDHLVPHLSHRRIIRSLHQESPARATSFDYVIVDTRHPGWLMDGNSAQAWIDRLDVDASFARMHDRDGVFLFRKRRN